MQFEIFVLLLNRLVLYNFEQILCNRLNREKDREKLEWGYPLGVAAGVKGVYCSLWELLIGSCPRWATWKLKNSISHTPFLYDSQYFHNVFTRIPLCSPVVFRQPVKVLHQNMTAHFMKNLLFQTVYILSFSKDQ